MPEFLIWSTPKLIHLIEAADTHAAASAFLGEPASAVPVQGEPPACFVQATDGFGAPRTDETAIEFWRLDSWSGGRRGSAKA